MPKMSGRELAERLLTLHKETRVLYMSGFNDRHVDGSLLRKPFSVEQLGTQVREVLDAIDRDASGAEPVLS